MPRDERIPEHGMDNGRKIRRFYREGAVVGWLVGWLRMLCLLYARLRNHFTGRSIDRSIKAREEDLFSAKALLPHTVLAEGGEGKRRFLFYPDDGASKGKSVRSAR